MSKNTLIEAMRAPRSISKDNLKVFVPREPAAAEAQVQRTGERRMAGEAHVGLQAAFGLGPKPPAARQ